METGTHVLLPDGKCMGVALGRAVTTRAVSKKLKLKFSFLALTNAEIGDSEQRLLSLLISGFVALQGKLECLVYNRGDEPDQHVNSTELLGSDPVWHVQLLGFYASAYGKVKVFAIWWMF